MASALSMLVICLMLQMSRTFSCSQHRRCPYHNPFSFHRENVAFNWKDWSNRMVLNKLASSIALLPPGKEGTKSTYSSIHLFSSLRKTSFTTQTWSNCKFQGLNHDLPHPPHRCSCWRSYGCLSSFGWNRWHNWPYCPSRSHKYRQWDSHCLQGQHRVQWSRYQGSRGSRCRYAGSILLKVASL